MAQCDKCKNNISYRTCKAFPDGKPSNIISGEFDHRQKYKGDMGVRFEPLKKSSRNLCSTVMNAEAQI